MGMSLVNEFGNDTRGGVIKSKIKGVLTAKVQGSQLTVKKKE